MSEQEFLIKAGSYSATNRYGGFKITWYSSTGNGSIEATRPYDYRNLKRLLQTLETLHPEWFKEEGQTI